MRIIRFIYRLIGHLQINTAVETFVGYLLLDTWIGNTDRHSENWGFIEQYDIEKVTQYLAPTFDHASSLGLRISDEERKERLTTKDSGYSLQAYATRCKSCFDSEVNSKKLKRLRTIEVFSETARSYPKATNIWLEQLAKISTTNTLEIFKKIPRDRISNITIEFAQKILEFNQSRLLDLK